MSASYEGAVLMINPAQTTAPVAESNKLRLNAASTAPSMAGVPLFSANRQDSLVYREAFGPQIAASLKEIAIAGSSLIPPANSFAAEIALMLECAAAGRLEPLTRAEISLSIKASKRPPLSLEQLEGIIKGLAKTIGN